MKVIPTFSFGQVRESGTPMRPLNFTHPFTSQPSDTKHLGSGKRQWDGFHQLLLNPDIQLQAWGTNAYFLRNVTTLLKQMFWEQHGAPPGSLEDSRYSGKGLPEHCMHPMDYKHGKIKQGETGFRSSKVASFFNASLQKNTAKTISHLAELLEVRGLNSILG